MQVVDLVAALERVQVVGLLLLRAEHGRDVDEPPASGSGSNPIAGLLFMIMAGDDSVTARHQGFDHFKMVFPTSSLQCRTIRAPSVPHITVQRIAFEAVQVGQELLQGADVVELDDLGDGDVAQLLEVLRRVGVAVEREAAVPDGLLDQLEHGKELLVELLTLQTNMEALS